jgi:spore coat protein CotH
MRRYYFLIGFLIFFGCDTGIDNSPAANEKDIMVLNSFMTQEELNALNEGRFTNFSASAKVVIGDDIFHCSFESQGAGSRFYPKWGYKVTCEPYKTIAGLNQFNLSNQVYDKSLIRTALSSHIYKQLGFLVFKSDHAFLRINNTNKGLYVLTERIDENFFSSRLIPVAELVKVGFDAKFTFEGGNFLSDHFEKIIPDDDNLRNFAEFVNALDTCSADLIPTALARYFDIDVYLKYHALTFIINNIDGLGNNFYFFKTSSREPYTIIPWDFDKSFNTTASTNGFGDNEIIKKLLRNQDISDRYEYVIKNILHNYFKEDNLFPVIDSVYNRIKNIYNADPFLGGGGINLQTETDNLKEFIRNRRNYLLSIFN